MRLGIALPIGRGEEPSGDVVSRDARAAEEAGFDSVWFFDSIGRGRMSLDPLIGVSVAAAASTRLEVGTGILQAPLRNPVELAHRVLSAQMVCEGRLLLGVGAGLDQGATSRRWAWTSTAGCTRCTRAWRRCGGCGTGKRWRAQT